MYVCSLIYIYISTPVEDRQERATDVAHAELLVVI